jgi:PAP2 superfamily
MALAFVRKNEMKYLAFSPSHEWQQDLIHYAKFKSVLFTNLDSVISRAKLKRPTPVMIDGAVKRLKRKSRLRMGKLAEICAENDSLFDVLESVMEAGKVNDTELKQFEKLIIQPAWNDLLYVLMSAKAYFNVARPFQYSPELKPLFFPEHPSFPSGHATQAYVIYLLFAAWKPALEAKLKSVALKIGKNREIAGVHYSFDSVAGRALARSFVTQFLRHPEIRRRMKKFPP